MTHEEFMNAMLKPTFVWRMATGLLGARVVYGGDGRQTSREKGAATRMANAQKAIDRLVTQRYHTIHEESMR